MKNLYYSVVLLLLISLIGCKSNYEKGVELIKEQKYDLALENLEKVKKGDDNYEEAISSINFINGLKSYNSGKYEESVSFLSKVYYDDSFRKTADSLMNYIKNSPKYHYEIGQKEFDASKYNLAYLEFIKIPESSEEYKFCKSKILFCQAINFKNENKLDTALIILHDINESDPIYAKVQNEIKYIERKSEFLKAKEYYENKKYDNALELLKKIDVNEDYYNEVKNLIYQIENIQTFNKYNKIKQIEYKYESELLLINNNIKLPVQKAEFMSIYFDKFSERNTFKEILSFKNYYHSNFKSDGGLNPKYGEVFGYFEVMLNKPYQLNLYNWSDYKIEDKELRDKMSNNPNDYKIGYIFKIDHIYNDYSLYNIYTKNLRFYIIDKNENIVYKSEESED